MVRLNDPNFPCTPSVEDVLIDAFMSDLAMRWITGIELAGEGAEYRHRARAVSGDIPIILLMADWHMGLNVDTES